VCRSTSEWWLRQPSAILLAGASAVVADADGPGEAAGEPVFNVDAGA
jgi:hypothetical protein